MTVPPTRPVLEPRQTDPHPTGRRPGPRRGLPPTFVRIIILVAIVALVLLVAQLFDGTTTDPDPVGPPIVEPEPVDGTDPITPPTAVELTADQIREAAAASDWDRLAALALAGDGTFTATFGEDLTTVEDLASYWRGVATEEDLPRIIPALITLPEWAETSGLDADGRETTIHVTPRFMHEPTDAARAELEDALGAEWLERQIADGQYLGWRIGITEEGDWLFLVQGD